MQALRKKIWGLASVGAVCIGLAIGLWQNAAFAQPNAMIEQWIDTLQAQPCCSNFHEAEWTSYPLGPGTHSTLIQLSKNGQDVGYFVLHAKPDGGWQLGEYGTGPYPLFGSAMLYKELSQLEWFEASDELLTSEAMLNQICQIFHVERLYFNGLEALWRLKHLQSGEILFADAKTAEMYPEIPEMVSLSQETLSGQSWPASLPLQAMPAANAIEATEAEAFDPYHHIYWLITDPVEAPDAAAVGALLAQGEPVTYVSSLYENFATMPYAVVETLQWEDQNTNYAWIGIDHFGTKYIPFTQLINLGAFYVPHNQ